MGGLRLHICSCVKPGLLEREQKKTVNIPHTGLYGTMTSPLSLFMYLKYSFSNFWNFYALYRSSGLTSRSKSN